MTAESEHMILEQLQLIRGTGDAIRVEVSELRRGMATVEAHPGGVQVQLAGPNGRMDRCDARLTRIERRLDIVDA